MPANILNLPCYKVLGIQENEHDYHIDVEAAEPPTSCPHCQSSNLVGFGRREQMVKDLPMHARRVGLYIDTRRFRCRSCGKTFYEALPEIDEKRLMTKRLAQRIGKQAIKRTFAGIAKEVGCTEFTVRAVFSDYVNELEKTTRFETPKWMGIDEIHLIKPRGVITNIQNNTIVELLPNRNKDTVVRFLHHLEGKERIQYVAMDMWMPYRDAVRAVIPQAEIVVAKFHVVRMANDAMERVRKSLRESLTPKQRRGLMHDRFVLLKHECDLNDKERLNLDGWTKNYPELGEAYRLKEQFFGIYDAESPDDAQAKFIQWQKSIPPEIADAFADIERAWGNWTMPIINYFNHPVTNAYTESLNGLIRVMDRLGRGYSFDALRAKILFAEGARKHKPSRPKFERQERRQPEPGPVMMHGLPGNFKNFEMADSFARMVPKPAPEPKPCIPTSTESGIPEKNYGADISTLIRMIENGEL
ncbi:ISL3 family transposase [Ferrovum sp.]|uniref:ISL3 family transposase n=1 Tax=Ferrovum sp. TaxID=2609467 RepID=UPI002604433F|nr:ISL3 family transposase [Ferrovum sp.]